MSGTSEAAPADARYSLFAVFGEVELVETHATADEAVSAIDELDDVTADFPESGVEIRGWYDISASEADGSVLVWLRAANVADLQWGLRQLRRVGLLEDTAVLRQLLVGETSEPDDAQRDWLSFAEVDGAAALEDDGDATDGSEVEVSTHALLGIGPARTLVVAESDDAWALAGDLAEVAGGLRFAADARILGRRVVSAELFEVLR